MGRPGRWALVVAVGVQLAVLYWPRVVDPAPGLPLDKLVHAVVFGAVTWTGLRAGLPAVPLAAVLLVHAGLSEVLQATVLPGRTGDPWDAVADATGVLAAWALARSAAGTRPRRAGTGSG